MIVERLAVPDVLLLTPPRYLDPRGFFSETWHADRYADSGIPNRFVQDNHALSREPFVLRGLHCQIGANAQGKLLRVVRGSIWDVAVDLRHRSPTYGQHAGAILSAENWQQIWVPIGFLHGYVTLERDTEVIYKVTAPYDKAAERGVVWDDPDLAVPWPVQREKLLLSDRDAALPRLNDCPVLFP